jgi:hypothetical protein
MNSSKLCVVLRLILAQLFLVACAGGTKPNPAALVGTYSLAIAGAEPQALVKL